MPEYYFESKVWGQVCHVFHNSEVAVSLLRVKKGYRCSRHLHRYRSNQFVVVSGMLEVWEWIDKAAVHSEPNIIHIIDRDRVATIPALRPHMFRVMESGIVVEIYARDKGPVQLDDIVRFDIGERDLSIP